MVKRRHCLYLASTAFTPGCLRLQESTAGNPETDPELGTPRPERSETAQTTTQPSTEQAPTGVTLTHSWEHSQSHVSHVITIGPDNVVAAHPDGRAAYDRTDGSTVWIAEFDDSLSAWSPLQLAGDSIFYGAEDGAMGSIDRESGDIEVINRAENPIRTLAVGTDYVAFATRTDDPSPETLPRIYVFERETRDLVNDFDGLGNTDSLQIFQGSLSFLEIHDDVVYSGISSSIEGYDLATDERFEVSPEGQQPVGAASVNDSVAYLTREGVLSAVDLQSQEELWDASIAGEPVSDTVIGDGVVLLADYSGVAAFDATTGRERWRNEFRDEALAGPVSNEGVCWYVDPDGNLLACDLRTGNDLLDAAVTFDSIHSLAVNDDILVVSEPSVVAHHIEHEYN